MLTIYETPTFVAEVAKRWPTEERLEFFAWIAGEFCLLDVYLLAPTPKRGYLPLRA